MAFLTAHWRDLLMINWAIPVERVTPWVPQGCEVDCFHGQTFASLVAFQFLKTRVKGIPIPGHRNFEEVNLRLYVKRTQDDGEVRRGVVFVREIVPRRMIAWVARVLYDEPYQAMPMSHQRRLDDSQRLHLQYVWGTHQVDAVASAEVQDLQPETESQFIAEHYWGYTPSPSGTREYRVSHPAWRWRAIESIDMKVDMGSLYGEEWSDLTTAKPSSRFVAEGSPVEVDPWSRLGAQE